MDIIQDIIDKHPALFKRFDDAFYSEAGRMVEALKPEFQDCVFQLHRKSASIVIVCPIGQLPLAVETINENMSERNDRKVAWAREMKRIRGDDFGFEREAV